VSDNSSLNSLSGGHNSLVGLDEKGQKGDERDQCQEEDGKVPGGMSSPLVSQISSVSSGRAKSSEQWDSSSEEGVSLVSIRKRSKRLRSIVEVLISRESSVSKVIRSSLSLVSVVNVLTDSSEVVLGNNEFLSVETSSIVNSVSLVHSNSEDQNCSQDDEPSEESRDDQKRSVGSSGSSILVGSEVNKVHKEQPWQPSNQHQDKDGCIDPLERRVVFVNLSSSDARAINEAIGSIKQSSMSIDSSVVVVERIF